MCKSIKSSCFFLSFLYKLLVFAFAFVSFSPATASAVQVTLEWDENSEEDLAGYRVFFRQEGHDYDYHNPAWDGVKTSCTVYGLDDNTTYYFVARAYNTSGEESSNSNQVCYLPEDPWGNQAPDGTIDTPAGDITIDVGDSVDFSGVGADPDENTPLTFLWDFGDPATADATVEDPGARTFNNPGVFTVSFTVTDSLGLSDPSPATRTVTVGNGSIPISKTGWSLLYVDSEELVGENGAAVNAFDGSSDTFWHTEWLHSDPPHPHEIQIDLGDVYDIAGFRYLPRQDKGANGRIGQYQFFVSMDGVNWDSYVASGVFQNDATEKEVLFSYPATGQFIGLVALTEANGGPWTSMAELNILGTAEVSLGISPPIRTLAVGEMVSFTASGGAPPYTFNLEVDKSGATLTDNGDGTADYIAGLTPGNDIVCVTDDLGTTVDAQVIVTKASMLISQSGWSVLSVDSEQVDCENEAEKAFDGDPMTHWHTKWSPTISPLPHELQIDLGDVYDIAGFRYLPRQDIGVNGRIGQYQFFVSMDGVNWDSYVASGVFQNDATEKEVLFSYPATGQFIRLVALTEANGGPWTSMAELNILSSN